LGDEAGAISYFESDMESTLQKDLERFGGMAFGRVADCRELISRFHGLNAEARAHPDYAVLREVYPWVFVPLTLWPVDVRGVGLHVLRCIEAGKQLDEEVKLLCSFLPKIPPEQVCSSIADYERAVKAGSYEELIEAGYKFELMEAELCQHLEFRADWERIKGKFAVERYRNAKGVIRRRMMAERNFRPGDWKFSWETEAQRFQNVFDAFCHRWDLYGMEGERPLLLKLTVNLTPYGTTIVVPRYWSFDRKRDVKWKAITRLHRVRGVQKQGPKLSAGRLERRQEVARARRLMEQAKRAQLKGQMRTQWVMGRLGWDARTDESRLRRLLKSEE